MAILQQALGRLAAQFPAAHATLQLGGSLYAAAGACNMDAVQPPPPWQRVPVVTRVSVVALPCHGEAARPRNIILGPVCLGFCIQPGSTADRHRRCNAKYVLVISLTRSAWPFQTRL